MKTTIPVILSSDNNYAKYLDVTLISILANAKKDTFYDVYILMSPDFSKKSQKLIQQDASKYKNNKINFVNLNNAFSGYKTAPHITTPAFYRLNASEILPKKYEKCIYLDVDICVRTDLKDYFNTDLENNIFAGVRDVMIKQRWFNFVFPRHKQKLKIDSLQNYINSGAIIMNLKIIRSEQLIKTFCSELSNNYFFSDQDVINKIGYNRIKILPLEYNFITSSDLIKQSKKFIGHYSAEEIENACKNPKIIHYAASYRKAWKCPHKHYSKYWWEYAKNSSFLQEIIQSNSEKKILKKKYQTNVSKATQR